MSPYYPSWHATPALCKYTVLYCTHSAFNLTLLFDNKNMFTTGTIPCITTSDVSKIHKKTANRDANTTTSQRST